MGDIINVFQTDIKMNIDTRTLIENQHSTCNTPTNYRNEYMKMSQRSKIQVCGFPFIISDTSFAVLHGEGQGFPPNFS